MGYVFLNQLFLPALDPEFQELVLSHTSTERASKKMSNLSDLTHAAIGLEVTLQGHGITSHHGRERLNVDSQVACGGKGRGW